jgi:hypothetical protein
MQDTNLGEKRNIEFEASREFWGVAAAGDRRLRTIHLRVIIVLQSYLNRETFTAFPSLPLIAKQVGAHVRSVQRAISDLEKWGYVSVKRRWNRTKNAWNSSVYTPGVPSCVVTATLYDRYEEILRGRLPPPGGEEMPPPPGAHATTSRRENVIITSDLTSEGTSKRTSTSTSHAFGVGNLQKKLGGKEERKEALQGGASSEPIAKPYSSEDVDLLACALSDGDKTYAGILSATRQEGFTGNGVGIDGNRLRPLLDDCMRARLVGTERRNGKDYFWTTEHGAENHYWDEVLGIVGNGGAAR